MLDVRSWGLGVGSWGLDAVSLLPIASCLFPLCHFYRLTLGAERCFTLTYPLFVPSCLCAFSVFTLASYLLPLCPFVPLCLFCIYSYLLPLCPFVPLCLFCIYSSLCAYAPFKMSFWISKSPSLPEEGWL